MQDDGVGIHVINLLKQKKLPCDADLIDGGTSTLDMLGYFLDYERVIIIDCLKAGYPPGTIYKIRPEEIKDFRKENLSLHDVQILDVVKIANLMGKNPEVIIFGIEPQSMEVNLNLTGLMAGKVPEVIKLIEEILSL